MCSRTLRLRRFFLPQKKSWDKLYVQFSSQTSVNIIYSHAKYLRKDQRLVTYIQLYERYRAMERLAYKLRHSEAKFKTRVKMGASDLILYKKKPGESTWRVLTSTAGLPPVNWDPAVKRSGQTLSATDAHNVAAFNPSQVKSTPSTSTSTSSHI